MAELHSITGLFWEDFGATPFGGYFVKSDEESAEMIKGDLMDVSGNLMEGMLNDAYGSSRIFGIKNPKSLTFSKKYGVENGMAVFDYEFTLKDGIWVGTYKLPGLDYHIKAICKTELMIEDLTLRRFDLNSTERSRCTIPPPEGTMYATLDSAEKVVE